MCSTQVRGVWLRRFRARAYRGSFWARACSPFVVGVETDACCGIPFSLYTYFRLEENCPHLIPLASTARFSVMFESEAGRGQLLPLLAALFAGGIVTLLVLPGPEQSSSALHQSNHSLLSTCGRLHAEALRAHSVADRARPGLFSTNRETNKVDVATRARARARVATRYAPGSHTPHFWAPHHTDTIHEHNKTPGDTQSASSRQASVVGRSGRARPRDGQGRGTHSGRLQQPRDPSRLGIGRVVNFTGGHGHLVSVD